MVTCTVCGQALAPRPYTHTTARGPRTVLDEGHTAPTCDQGHVELSTEARATLERRALAALLREGPPAGLTAPASLLFVAELARDARHALALSQEDLAVLLDCRGESVSRWEKGHRPMPRAVQHALAGLLLGCAEGADLERMIGRARARALIRRVPLAEDVVRIHVAA